MARVNYVPIVTAILCEHGFNAHCSKILNSVVVNLCGHEFFVEIEDGIVYVSPADIVIMDHNTNLENKFELADPRIFEKISKHIELELNTIKNGDSHARTNPAANPDLSCRDNG